MKQLDISGNTLEYVRLVSAHPPVGSVVVTTANRSWTMHERAEQAGCRALLDKPFDPGHLYRVFQMI